MISLTKPLLLYLLFFLLSFEVYSQQSISERKKLRYLKKIERKNDRYVKQQERKTGKLLTSLSQKEQRLYKELDSTKLDSAFVKNSFSKIKQRLEKEDSSAEALLRKTSQPLSIGRSVSTTSISESLTGDMKDYLTEQLKVTSFFADSTCSSCGKLKEQGEQAKQNIAKTTEKLERLKAIQADIKKQQETLKNYGIKTPELASRLKAINKECYYYTQGMNGFKDLYINPAKGIESSLLKNLSFSKDFKLFQSQMNTLPIGTSSLNPSLLSGNVTPDMTGYQTKTQVQAMLPQNAQGITPDIKTQLISNMQNGLNKFTELRDEKPDVTMFKDKPDFKINPYKGLPIIKRLVPGFMFQPQIKKQNEPILIHVGATLGFKLNPLLTPMIGASSKLGLGEDIRHLAFSYQGIIAKAGLDVKLCFGFSFQGWYEATWRPLPDLLPENKIPNYPEPSLIAGICNTYQISKKVKGTLMIGYDFFYNKHAPHTSPWVIRMGWQ